MMGPATFLDLAFLAAYVVHVLRPEALATWQVVAIALVAIADNAFKAYRARTNAKRIKDAHLVVRTRRTR
jgi:hypothetical protein